MASFSCSSSCLSHPLRRLAAIESFPFRYSITIRYLHEGPDTIDELLDRHLHKSKPPEDDELQDRRRLTSTRREALSLYRDIIRASRFFTWRDSRGVPWRDVLRENARKEFEEARFERDPEIVTRLLIGGRDAVQAALDKLVDTHKRKMAEGGDQDGRR